MGYTVNSIIIKKEMNELFEIINDVRDMLFPCLCNVDIQLSYTTVYNGFMAAV